MRHSGHGMPLLSICVEQSEQNMWRHISHMSHWVASLVWHIQHTFLS